MRFSLVILSLFLSCFLGAAGVVASEPQVEDMDKALDKYELLCDECVDLMLRLEAGEKVSRSVVSGLLSSLSDLRKILRESSGSMSPAQRKRFERIKERYAMAVGGPKETEKVAALSLQLSLLPRLCLRSNSQLCRQWLK